MVEEPIVRLMAGDQINGWSIVERIPTPPFKTIQWRGICFGCGAEMAIREDVVIRNALGDCPRCRSRR